MRLGLGSYACAWAAGVPAYERPQRPLTAVGLVERAAELGLYLVQICDNLPLDRLTPGELDDLARRAAELSVSIVPGTRGIDLGHLRRYLDLASRFGSSLLRSVVDTATRHPAPSEIVDALKALVPDLEAAGVTLAIENHDRFRAHALREIIQRVDSAQVGVCLDTVNSFGALEGPQAVVDTLAPWVVDLHIKDFRIARAPHNMGFVLIGAPAGQGQLDVPWLLAELKADGRRCDAILELWPPPQTTIAETVALERVWAEQSVAYLRTLIPG